MEMKKILKNLADEYIRIKGNSVLRDPDTPSFIRKNYNYTIPGTAPAIKGRQRKIAPGSITNLLNVLFGEEDVKFA